MPEPITLQQALDHLREDAGVADELITSMIAAARNHCENELGVTITATHLIADGVEHPIPDVVISAMKLMLWFFYNCRDDSKEIPAAVGALLSLSPLRRRLGAA